MTDALFALVAIELDRVRAQQRHVSHQLCRVRDRAALDRLEHVLEARRTPHGGIVHRRDRARHARLEIVRVLFGLELLDDPREGDFAPLDGRFRVFFCKEQRTPSRGTDQVPDSRSTENGLLGLRRTLDICGLFSRLDALSSLIAVIRRGGRRAPRR